MSKNITINSQNYTGKSVIKAQLTDGSGYASFVDVSGVTATADDVATGKIFVNASGATVTGTGTASTGGSDLSTIEVHVADYYVTDDLSVTIGALDKYKRIVVS